MGTNLGLAAGLGWSALLGLRGTGLLAVAATLGVVAGFSTASLEAARAGLPPAAAMLAVIRYDAVPVVASTGTAIGILAALTGAPPATSPDLLAGWSALASGTAVALVVMRFLRRRGSGPLDADDLTVVAYRGAIVAVVADGEIWLAPRIEALEKDHPRRRFVAVLCIVHRELRSGSVPPPHDADAAEGCARSLLMDERAFCAVAHAPDHAVAEKFNVPLEQVAARREELGKPAARTRSSDRD